MPPVGERRNKSEALLFFLFQPNDLEASELSPTPDQQDQEEATGRSSKAPKKSRQLTVAPPRNQDLWEFFDSDPALVKKGPKEFAKVLTLEYDKAVQLFVF